MRSVQKGFRTAGQVGTGLVGMYGTAKMLGHMGSELYAGMQMARAAAGVAAPLALAL